VEFTVNLDNTLVYPGSFALSTSPHHFFKGLIDFNFEHTLATSAAQPLTYMKVVEIENAAGIR
jgi:hypothetical protein